MNRRLALLVFCLSAFLIQASAAPLSGTKTIGPTGNYASITAAIADIQAQSLGGPLVLELQPAYVSTVETFPLAFTNLTTTAANTLTLRPASGSVGLSITSANTTAATVDLNGAQFVTLDGRPGGTGTAKQLTIANTSTSGVAVRFINEAGSNILRHVTLQGVNTSATSGTVVFSTTTGANGNDNNTIDTCDLRDGASTPANALYALGTTTSTARNNSGNAVTNCNVFNFYRNAAVDSAGVRIDGGNTGWTITGNSFYQSASRAAVAANVRPISVNNPSGNNFTLTGNFIGGSAARAGGTAWRTTGTAAAYLFQGILLNVGSTPPSSVQGNTIQNIVWTTSSTATTLPGVWTGVYVQAGSVNIGTGTGNTIGRGTGTGSISVTTSGAGGTTFGIGSASSGTVAIANNTIGSITTNNSDDASASLVGIQVTAGANSIANNTVGSTTTANSLNAATSAGPSAQQVTGILSSSTTSAIITGNAVANLNNNYDAALAGGQIRGIVTSAGVNTIIGNTVRNLATTSRNENGGTDASVLGIIQTATLAGQTVSQNVVHSLVNNPSITSTTVWVLGIYYEGSTTGSNVIARNLVHSLSTDSTSDSSALVGMFFGAGTFTAQNNMVRVGLDASGASTAGISPVVGIVDFGTTEGRNFYHNSVYVGGTAVFIGGPQSPGRSPTYAFFSDGITNTRDFRNNLFVNARSNSGGATSKHYAVAYARSTGLTANNNLFFVSGTGGVLGRYLDFVDYSTLAEWQSATGVDAASLHADPLFVNPTGSAATGDLHLQGDTPAEGAGTLLASVTDDFDGQTRSALSPVDIGADAGGFFPAIIYPGLGFGTTANRVLTGWASIASPGGVSGGASAPRFYFKKATESDVFGVANDSTGNGWKYVTASNGSSPYSFTVDYALLTSGRVSSGDTIQYFVVAQDEAGNFRSIPHGAATSASPPVQNVSAKPTSGAYSYSIVDTIGGTVTVGPGGTFTGLTGAAGLFAALNSRVLTGNLTVNVTGNTTEDGSTALTALTSNNDFPLANAFTVTIQPGSPTVRSISGAGASGLIRLSGAQRVTIDGRFGGTGRYLTIRNTTGFTNAPTITFINDASNNMVRNCVIEGKNTSGAVVFFSTGVSTGNDNNTLTGNQIRDRSDIVAVPGKLVYSSGTSVTVANSNNTISNNELFNFTQCGVFVDSGSESWSITGNTIYETAAQNASLTAICFNGLGTNTIRGNTVRDLMTANGAYGIYLSSQTGNTTVAGNRLWNLGTTAGSAGAACGIFFQPDTGQSVTAVNNMVALSSSGTTAHNLYGIRDQGATGSTVVTAYNTVLITGTGGTGGLSRDTWAFNRRGNSTATVKNNLFLNLRTGGGSHFAANHRTTGIGPLTMDYNIYVGTGLNSAANFFDSSDGSANTGTPISYAQWKTNVPSDTHSSAGTPGGNYTNAMFVDPAIGDLHLIPGGNPLVNNAGTPVAGVTTDFDGETRGLVAPEIGADELISSNADLSNLALSNGALNPAFAPATVFYTASVPFSSSSILVTPTQTDGNATVTVNGNSVATPVTLNVGANTVSVLVTAQDNTMKTYTVVVTRRTVFQDWAVANGVASDPNALGANGVTNLLNFAFGMNPTGAFNGALVLNGTFGAGGTIGVNGQPITMLEPTANGVDFRALYVRRKDYVNAGLTYAVEFSPANLSPWTTSTAAPTVLADDGTCQIVSVPYPPFIGGKKARFFRVSVTLAP